MYQPQVHGWNCITILLKQDEKKHKLELKNIFTGIRDEWMKLLVIHIQSMTVLILLADEMYKKEPQCKWLHFAKPYCGFCPCTFVSQ